MTDPIRSDPDSVTWHVWENLIWSAWNRWQFQLRWFALLANSSCRNKHCGIAIRLRLLVLSNDITRTRFTSNQNILVYHPTLECDIQGLRALIWRPKWTLWRHHNDEFCWMGAYRYLNKIFREWQHLLKVDIGVTRKKKNFVEPATVDWVWLL